MSESASDFQTVIDFKALQARCLGNLNLMERVLAKFVVQVDSDLLLLQNAVEDGNTVDAAEIAHRIKGTAGSVEAKQLYRDALQFEEAALADRTNELPELLRNVEYDRAELATAIGESGAGCRPAAVRREPSVTIGE